jgi:hypothetical protein
MPDKICDDLVPAVDIIEGRMMLSSADARLILERHDYDQQRPTERGQVALLQSLMERGLFEFGSQLAFGRFNGHLYLVNGRHRMRALAAIDRAVEFQVLIIECPTRQKLGELFYRFDINVRVRSEADIMIVTGIARKYDIASTLAVAVFNAAPVIESGFRVITARDHMDDPTPRTIDGKLNAAEKYWRTSQDLNAIIEMSDAAFRPRMRKVGIVAVALVTLGAKDAETRERAHEFWRGVCVDADKGEPARTLRDFLISKQLRQVGGGRLYSMAVPATAWNAFYKGKSLTVIKTSRNFALKILGTEYVINEAK